MKRLLIAAAGLGLILAIAIVAYQGFAEVSGAFAAVGYGLAVIVMVRAGELAGAGLAWWIVFPRAAKTPLAVCIWVRFIREAINTLLPVAQVGGEIAGARAMALSGSPAGLAGATLLVDTLMQVVSLFLFVVVGVGILATYGADDALVGSMMAGISVMGVALAGFFVAQRFGGAKLVDRALMALADRTGWSALANLATLHDNLVRIYADVPRFVIALLVHLAFWFFGALEVLVTLNLMGYPASYVDAVVIESLGQAVRAAGFLVPGALGVQEAGFIAVCAVFGIPPAEAVALSLVKRVPEIVLGVPFLLAWHRQEAKALLRSG
ncbi:MAG TPA: lysylphosphatidylglycerol synthase domain-containing protein [Pseudolabrys sp.]|nr:lysylphosphatidylglycerol synthase domain-containing protein [Pseudolabrys sp.]